MNVATVKIQILKYFMLFYVCNPGDKKLNWILVANSYNTGWSLTVT